MSKIKLILWDFDGVIADSECLWIDNWRVLLNEKFGLDWDFKRANEVLGGLAPKTKIENLAKLGIEIDDTFLAELKVLDKKVIDAGISPTPEVEDIFKLSEFAQCIATGGNFDKTEHKLDVLGFRKYFPDSHIFTAQQVRYGKPEPDLFLYACEQMGFEPSEAVVVEDSLAGLFAGLRAGMLTVAFVGAQMNNNSYYIAKVKEMGIKHIFDNMRELKEFLIFDF